MTDTRLLQVSLSTPGESADGDPLAANEETFLEMLDSAARFDPDFVVVQELALAGGLDRSDRDLREIAHEFPGEFTDRVGERARDLESYVWVTGYEREEGDVYNAAALVSPTGEHLGTYRKVAPTTGEMVNRGVTPGGDLPVWDTEFGRVGATICQDVRYDDIALGYRAQELDLMFHPSHGAGGGKLSHWASYHGFHVAYCWGADLRVYTPHGREMGRETGHPTMPTVDFESGGTARFAPTTINTNMRSYARGDFDYGDTELNDVQRAYPDRIEIHELNDEGIIVVESTDDDLDIADVEAEFGLPTTNASEMRGRELVAERIDDSPLFGPDAFPSASDRSDPPAQKHD